MDKPSLSALASKMGGDSEESPSDDTGPQDPMLQAASLVREAIEDKDDEALADALKSFCTMHGTSGGSSAGKPALTIHLGHKD